MKFDLPDFDTLEKKEPFNSILEDGVYLKDQLEKLHGYYSFQKGIVLKVILNTKKKVLNYTTPLSGKYYIHNCNISYNGSVE